MNRLFGKARPKVAEPPKPTLNDATGALTTRIGELDGKIKGLDEELLKYKQQLSKATGTTKATLQKRALDVLKRKKMYETQRDQMSNQQFNIDQTVFAIETVKATQVTVAAMKDASKVLKAENAKISLNEIEDMQDDMEELLEDAGEISEILGRSYATPDDIDEADLDAELACLGDELESIDVETSVATSAMNTGSSSASSLNVGSSISSYSMPVQPTSSVSIQSRNTNSLATPVTYNSSNMNNSSSTNSNNYNTY